MSCGRQLVRHIGERSTASIDATSDPTLDTPTISSSDAAASAAVLVVRQGPKRGSRIALDAELTTIGRHPDSDIFLDDITVSRRHAEIARQYARKLETTLEALHPERTCQQMEARVDATSKRIIEEHAADQQRFDRVEAASFERRMLRMLRFKAARQNDRS